MLMGKSNRKLCKNIQVSVLLPAFYYYEHATELKTISCRVVGPKIELVEELEATLRKKEEEQAKSKAVLDNLLQFLRKLELEYEEKTKLKEEFQRQAEHLKLKLERAHMLIDGLGKENLFSVAMPHNVKMSVIDAISNLVKLF